MSTAGLAGVLARTTPGGALTPAQARLLALVAEGCSNEEIARRSHISIDTVKSHMAVLFRKLRARNRTHAVALGFAPHGFVAMNDGRLVPKAPPVEVAL
jgi:DNA-binding CsgD family transcriptional regulator